MSSYTACLLFLILSITKDSLQINSPAAEFSRHRVVRPTVHRDHDRHRRHISNGGAGGHAERMSVSVEAEGEGGVGGERRILQLTLNRGLLPHNHTLAYHANGTLVRHTPRPEDTELCQYQGKVEGVETSWAAVSTCRGLRGVFYDGHELHYLEPAGGDMSSPHYLYRHSDLSRQHDCGYRGGITNNTRFDPELYRMYDHHNDIISRRKRSAERYSAHGPYNANRQSRYVELALVMDQAGYRANGENLHAIHTECKDIANIINAMYSPLNIFIALVYVEVWTEGDKIRLLDKGDDTLTNFLHYRRTSLLLAHHNDNAQLLTRHRFDNGVVGKALKGTMCTYEYSGGINTNHSDVVGLVATTIAHEMGHNFGMEHDSEEDCKCPDKKCIMSPSSNSVSPVHWSSCSQEALALAFEHGLDYCLRNKPKELFESPTCGNGFVEAGEECDCGPAPGACGACCHPDTCTLRRNATCATGHCCDLTTCGVRAAGSECRAAMQECDLPEYCTGYSEFCPIDVHKMNSLPCDDGQAYCYEGSCRSHTDQCRLLWGYSGVQSHEKCYTMNKNGSRSGNCGYDRLRKQYEKCAPADAMCGMLHCRHLNEQLEFGVESVSTLSHTFINIDGTIIPCRTALVDLGLNQVDPGLVPDGAKCGQDKMCESRKCVRVADVRARLLNAVDSVCPSDCSGHGVCNSKGHCHCERGFSSPLCALPGPGGSIDSGPASNPNVQRNFMVAMYVMFLGVVPSLLIMLLLSYYSRQNILLWWKRPRKLGGGRSFQHRDAAYLNEPSNAAPLCLGTASSLPTDLVPKQSQSPKKESLQRRLSRGASKLAANLQGGGGGGGGAAGAAPLRPLASPDDMSSSLLRSDSDPSTHSAHFFGHFKGFSLTPLEKAQVQDAPPVSVIGGLTPRPADVVPVHVNKAPVRSAPPVPVPPVFAHMSPKLDIKRTNSSVQNRIKSIMDKSENCITNAPSRPTISSPILEASTCTAKELISPLQGSKTLGPTRSAPGLPKAQELPKRPLSMETNVFLKPLPDEPAPKKSKEGTTLNRIASFLKQDKARNPVERSHSLPKNQNQLKILKPTDKTALRNLQISNPILQKDIALSVNTVPVISDTDEPEDSKLFVGRAQSMRGPSVAQRPSIPSFGSMRQASGVARPVSIVLGSRPTAPPPPRPKQPLETAPDAPGYQNTKLRSVGTDVKSPEYVDCIGEKQAPLANINEESPGDNIYAVIEESPMLKGNRAQPSAPIKTLPQAPPAGYNTPKPIVGSNSGSSESVGLLGEIVSEIQTRNLESIYSASTLARKKKEREKKMAAKAEDVNDNAAYANAERLSESEYGNTGRPQSIAASTTSSGYLHPSAVNVPRYLNNNEIATKPSAVVDKPPSPVAIRAPNSKIPALSRQPTPPGLRTQSSFRSIPSSPKNTTKLNASKMDNSPDVVSSCALNVNVKTGKSPDVVNNGNKTDGKSTQKAPPKPADKPLAKSAPIEKKIASKPNPLPKAPENKVPLQKVQPTPKVVAKPEPAKSWEAKSKPKPVAKPTSAVGRTDASVKPVAKLASRPSNVASLQQKFENRKSVGRESSK